MTHDLLWKPSPAAIDAAAMTKFLRVAEQRAGRSFGNYHELWSWSVTEIDAFWQLVWDQADVRHSTPPSETLVSTDMPGANWFPGTRLNFAANLLRHQDDHPAIVARSESRDREVISYRELFDRVAACARGLARLGVTTGDRVAGFMANVPETVIAMLATTSLGAIWSSSSPDFGFQGVMDRFGQIEPKVLIATDGYRYQGKAFDRMDEIRHLHESLPHLEEVVIVPFLHESPDTTGFLSWADLTSETVTELPFCELPFDHPVYIMYSSGTTGKPKCIVHGAGGVLLQHWKEHVLHTGITRDDRVFYFTTCGWMMWNWLISSLQIGATIVLYDGAPAYPRRESLFDLIDEESLTVFGTSPKFLSFCEHANMRPRNSHRLDSLRTILSTGAPLAGANFDYVYGAIRPEVCLSSISGGTDIVSCFMLGNPTLPVYREEIQCRGLGMAVECWSDDGQSLTDRVGELVCTQPVPSMPVSFWNDPDGSLYRGAYFEHFPGVWRHGDYIKITERSGVIVYGRSDATLNPGGVRIGTAEIYAPVEAMDEVVDSLVIGQRWHDDIRVVLFVVLAEGVVWSDALHQRIRATIRERTTPRHVPAVIVPAPAIPHTLNGKKVEIAVTRIIHGESVTNRDALANPESLDFFADLPHLDSAE